MSAAAQDPAPTEAELDRAWLEESLAGRPLEFADPDTKARLARIVARSAE